MIYLDGSSTSLMSICSGNERFDELWVGDDKIWPDVTGSGGFVIELPAAGTLEYQYWLHAVDASEDGNEGYMKFTVDGTDFYINSGPNGSEVVQLRGDIISLNEKQREMIAGKLLNAFTVTCEITKRTKPIFSRAIFGESLTNGVLLPVLRGTLFQYSQACAGRGNWSWSRLKIISKPSGLELLSNGVDKKSRTWITYGFTASQAPASDTGYLSQASISGSGWIRDLSVTYPAFSREFQLNIISFS